MAKPKIKNDGGTITVRVPIAIRKRGGRKVVLAPDGAVDTNKLFCQRIDNAMVKAIARAFRWRDMLEGGKYATIEEIAASENINNSYVARILRLTLLAPEVVQSIVEGRQSPTLSLPILMKPFAPIWAGQRTKFVLEPPPSGVEAGSSSSLNPGQQRASAQLSSCTKRGR